jgi:phosphoserine phosphatase RsbU/P
VEGLIKSCSNPTDDPWVAIPLRLVRDEPLLTPVLTSDEVDGEEHPGSQVAALDGEIRTLRQEVALLRRRDEMVHIYLHRLDEELRLAARLQYDFLPKDLPEVGAVRFHTLFRPAGYVSGDLYDVFRLDETHVGFYLADAIGHGVPAALLTMFLRTSLVSKEIFARGYRILTPGEALSRLNGALIAQNFSQTTFATAVYGVIDSATGEVAIARAGHPCPIFIPGDAAKPLAELDCGNGALLGVFANESYPTSTVTLNPGDRIFIHSDGIDAVFVDELNSDSQFWTQQLDRMRSLPTPSVLGEFSKRLDRRAGSLEPKDDLTIITVEINS